MSERSIDHRYDDPVDLIWIRAARDLGPVSYTHLTLPTIYSV